ncbi:hypothetical protein I6F23_22575 [Bradyrhizobium sp. NBAIM02]|nr:hypothetical protein [Bradyrhizobium sp. NBAIM02]MCA1506667.1 hypothetical protein [Bradyrhizobium sp. NBAIM02]
MAEQHSWPSLKRYGLLSTSALLDHFEICGDQRMVIEAQRRPKSVTLETVRIGRAVVRDQFPMDDKGLLRCLQDGLTPRDWYQLLNGKVFFWLTRDRLLRLLNAGNYRLEEHDVLEIDAARLVGAYRDKIWLSPMNSGCTKPIPHPRGKDTFMRISDYPYSDWSKKRKRGERVVELCVDYSVPDITKFVKRVVRMKGDEELETIFER